jgi:flagellar hook-basal body complex protein FliE
MELIQDVLRKRKPMSGNVEFNSRVFQSPNQQSSKISQSETSLSGTQSAGKSFSDTLNDALKNVNELQKSSDKGMQDLATGRTDNIPEVMIAAEKADLALKLMVQVRNKIIDAYHEVMKMQV